MQPRRGAQGTSAARTFLVQPGLPQDAAGKPPVAQNTAHAHSPHTHAHTRKV